MEQKFNPNQKPQSDEILGNKDNQFESKEGTLFEKNIQRYLTVIEQVANIRISGTNNQFLPREVKIDLASTNIIENGSHVEVTCNLVVVSKDGPDEKTYPYELNIHIKDGKTSYQEIKFKPLFKAEGTLHIMSDGYVANGTKKSIEDTTENLKFLFPSKDSD